MVKHINPADARKDWRHIHPSGSPCGRRHAICGNLRANELPDLTSENVVSTDRVSNINYDESMLMVPPSLLGAIDKFASTAHRPHEDRNASTPQPTDIHNEHEQTPLLPASNLQSPVHIGNSYTIPDSMSALPQDEPTLTESPADSSVITPILEKLDCTDLPDEQTDETVRPPQLSQRTAIDTGTCTLASPSNALPNVITDSDTVTSELNVSTPRNASVNDTQFYREAPTDLNTENKKSTHEMKHRNRMLVPLITCPLYLHLWTVQLKSSKHPRIQFMKTYKQLRHCYNCMRCWVLHQQLK